MSLRDFYMERLNLSNDPRFRASMRGSSCYTVVRERGDVAIQFDVDIYSFSEEEIREIARVHGKKAKFDETYETWDLEEGWVFRVPVATGVCPTCNGCGSVVNPAIDAGGLTPEEVAEYDDPEDDYWYDDEDDHYGRPRNAYLDGEYNISCPECKGENVVRVPVLSALAKPLREYVAQWEKDLDYDLALQMAEFRAGC